MSGVLGQTAPNAAAWTDIYTCPASTVASCRVIVTNRSSVSTTFRAALAPNGAVIADEQWIAGDKFIQGNDTGSTIAFVLQAAAVVRVYATLATLSFTITGETRAA